MRPVSLAFLSFSTRGRRHSLYCRQLPLKYASIVSFPEIDHDHPLILQVFTTLCITKNINSTDPNFGPPILADRPVLSCSGREVKFKFDTPREKVSPDNTYTQTAPPVYRNLLQGSVTSMSPTPLEEVKMSKSERFDVGEATTSSSTCQSCIQAITAEGHPVIDGTVFVMLIDKDIFTAPANLTELNPHVVAGPALYQAG